MGKALKPILSLLTLITGISLWSSCGDEGCTEPTTSYTVASLTAEPGTSPVGPKSLSVYGIGQQSDSLMINSVTTFQGISLILDPDTTYTQMLFEFPMSENDTIRDTLDFHYKNQLYFLTIDCGCTVQNYLDSILHTSNLIKRIEIINPEVTNEKKPNITLYY